MSVPRRARAVVLIVLATFVASLPRADALTEIGTDDFQISTTGTPSDTLNALFPTVAYNPTADEFVAVWQADKTTDDEYEVYARRISRDGTPLGSEVQVSHVGPDGDTDFSAGIPQVAFDTVSQRYLVVFAYDDLDGPTEEGEVHVQLLTPTLAPVGPDDFRISDMGPDGNAGYDVNDPDVSVAPHGGEFLVVWYGDDNTGALVDNEQEIYGQRVSPSGAELGTNDFRISVVGPDGDENYRAFTPTVAADPVNDRYLVVFGEKEPGDPVELYGQRLSATGAAIGTDFQISEQGNGSVEDTQPTWGTVAADTNHGGFLVAWGGSHAPLAVDDLEVWGSLVSGTGATNAADFQISASDSARDAGFPRATYVDVTDEWLVIFGTIVDDNGPEVFGRALRRDGAAAAAIRRLTTTDPFGDLTTVAAPFAVVATADGVALVIYLAGDAGAGSFEVYAHVAHGGSPDGYRLLAGDGGTFAFGERPFHGSLADLTLAAPIVGGGTTPGDGGQFLFAADGGVFAHGNAQFEGSLAETALNAPVAGGAVKPTGDGYWMFGENGAVYAFGDAQYYGSATGDASARIIGGAPTTTGRGYWLFGDDGAVYAFGDAAHLGSMDGTPLSAPIVAGLATPTGNGYWMFASDGGVFSFGDAGYFGSMGGTPLNGPMVAALATSSGDGYWMFAADGGVFAFGDAEFFGSMGGTPLNQPIVTAT